jgi:hypothetical protein
MRNQPEGDALLGRHGGCRIFIGLPCLGLAALVIYGWTQGEPANSWPLLCGVLVAGLVFLLDGLRLLRMIPGKEQPATQWMPDESYVDSMLMRAGPARGNLDKLPFGARNKPGTSYSRTIQTGQVTRGGEIVEVTACFDRRGNLLGVEYHLQDNGGWLNIDTDAGFTEIGDGAMEKIGHSTYPGRMPSQAEYNALVERESALAHAARAAGFDNAAGLLLGERYAIDDDANAREAAEIQAMWQYLKGRE